MNRGTAAALGALGASTITALGTHLAHRQHSARLLTVASGYFDLATAAELAAKKERAENIKLRRMHQQAVDAVADRDGLRTSLKDTQLQRDNLRADVQWFHARLQEAAQACGTHRDDIAHLAANLAAMTVARDKAALEREEAARERRDLIVRCGTLEQTVDALQGNLHSATQAARLSREEARELRKMLAPQHEQADQLLRASRANDSLEEQKKSLILELGAANRTCARLRSEVATHRIRVSELEAIANGEDPARADLETRLEFAFGRVAELTAKIDGAAEVVSAVTHERDTKAIHVEALKADKKRLTAELEAANELNTRLRDHIDRHDYLGLAGEEE